MNTDTRHHASKRELFERLHAALPQTQCTRCGYPDCAAYAQAIVDGNAAINQCPPGGAEGVQRLALISGHPVQALNEANGKESPRTVAVIDETWCIGCTLCVKACPTDAIFGSNKTMHTVIEPHCTGCELCLPVCPVDCISLESVTGLRTGWDAWSQPQADAALGRYESRHQRGLPLVIDVIEVSNISEVSNVSNVSNVSGIGTAVKTSRTPDTQDNMADSRDSSEQTIAISNEIERKRAAIEAVMAKVKSRRNNL